MIYKVLFGLILVTALAACSSQAPQSQISLPLLQAWYNGQKVYYITTDVSDQAVAQAKGANYAPRLQDAIPRYPKPPQVKTALERVYAFPKGEQASVFSSVPTPAGYQSTDTSYSPLWLMYTVTWNDSTKTHDLLSEEAILSAEDKGDVVITRTNVVLNCPVIKFP